MKNWLGHVLKPGDVVHRGMRQGDGTGNDLGVVIKVNEEKNTARVAWLFQSGTVYKRNPNGSYDWSTGKRGIVEYDRLDVVNGERIRVPEPKVSTGTSEGLIKIEPLSVDLTASQQRYLNTKIQEILEKS